MILEEKLSNKFKNGHKKFLPRKISRKKSLNFMVLEYRLSERLLMEVITSPPLPKKAKKRSPIFGGDMSSFDYT
jgi:hypothetical protein